jgi:histidinol-phosphatase (PHP family)
VIGDWIIDEPSEMGEYSRRGALQVYSDYFNLVNCMVKTRLFDTLAHPDLIKIFGVRPKESFSHILEETAEVIAESNICVEINTRGLRRPCHEIYPSEQFLAILHKHAVPIAFGSDAHVPEDAGRDFKAAIRLARKVGYTQMYTFDRRHRTLVEL